MNAGSAIDPAMDMNPLLSIRHICKNYGDTTALDDVSLTIARGEFFDDATDSSGVVLRRKVLRA